MQNSKFSFRAIQMDIARQPETVSFIKEQILFFEKCGYNVLVLYLEGRIRTECFNVMPKNMSYSKDEIREIVAYASEHGLETIPVVSFFGHAEHFFEAPGNDDLCEVARGGRGRFSSSRHVFCPSQKRTLEFIEAYAREVSELFPSPYFHVGFDEAWDIGYCPICSERVKKEGQSGIFASHTKAVYDIIVGKLGKRMIMWDDLFDIYPDALEETPRDVILCAWHYDFLVENPYGHAGGPRRDMFSLYEKMGFKVIFAPASFSTRNIETFTQYAAKASKDVVLGGLLTVWEAPDACDEPAVAFAGKLWSTGEATLEEALRSTTPLLKQEEFSLALYFLKERAFQLPRKIEGYFAGELNHGEYERYLVNNAARSLLAKYKDDSNRFLEEFLIRLDIEKVYFELRKILPKLSDPSIKASISAELLPIKQLAADINRRRNAVEMRLRPDRMSTRSDRVFGWLEKMISELPTEGPLGNAVLRVRFPHNTSIPLFRLRTSASRDWVDLKPATSGYSLMSGETLTSLPFDLSGVPEELSIELTGAYVGSDLMYAEIATATERYVPVGITNIEGAVSHPEALLNDGRDRAHFGDGEVQAFRKFNNPSSLGMVSSVRLRLAEAKTVEGAV